MTSPQPMRAEGLAQAGWLSTLRRWAARRIPQNEHHRPLQLVARTWVQNLVGSFRKLRPFAVSNSDTRPRI